MQSPTDAKTRTKRFAGKIGAALFACCFAAPAVSFASYGPLAAHSATAHQKLTRYADADDYYRANPHYAGGADQWRDQRQNHRAEEQNERFNAWQNRRAERFQNRMDHARVRHQRHEMREQRRED